MSEKKLVKKLVEVMKQVKYIQKTGFNSFHKYKYATEADVNEKVREVLAEHNVVMIPNVKSHAVREHTNARGNREYIVTVEVEFTFMDGETGETISFTTFGEGQDAGDKGTYKAITGAQKYALMKAFMIPTGDDPEADDGVDERNNEGEGKKAETTNQKPRTNGSVRELSEAQVKRLFAIANKNGYSAAQVKQALMKYYNKVEVAELTKEEYDELCNRMETAGKGQESA